MKTLAATRAAPLAMVALFGTGCTPSPIASPGYARFPAERGVADISVVGGLVGATATGFSVAGAGHAEAAVGDGLSLTGDADASHSNGISLTQAVGRGGLRYRLLPFLGVGGGLGGSYMRLDDKNGFGATGDVEAVAMHEWSWLGTSCTVRPSLAWNALAFPTVWLPGALTFVLRPKDSVSLVGSGMLAVGMAFSSVGGTGAATGGAWLGLRVNLDRAPRSIP